MTENAKEKVQETFPIKGLLEVAYKGFGFIRSSETGYAQMDGDVYVSPYLIEQIGLRSGVILEGLFKKTERGPQLVEVLKINSISPKEALSCPRFSELKAVNPEKKLSFETTSEIYTTRVLDLITPIGRGQRGLIISPPRSGKTTLLMDLAKSIEENYKKDVHLIIVLVDERPEEVTEFKRTFPKVEIFASSNDMNPKAHCRMAEIAIERAKRLVEMGQDVFILMDSITRLARAYNRLADKHKKGRGYQTGGLSVGAMEKPRRIFAAARNTREAGSLTILATALVKTNSKADEAIFQEFKGTGNMDLFLERKIAEQYIYPAVDIAKSGTRCENLLLSEHSLNKISILRRGLSSYQSIDAMEKLLKILKKFENNSQLLVELK